MDVYPFPLLPLIVNIEHTQLNATVHCVTEKDSAVKQWPENSFEVLLMFQGCALPVSLPKRGPIKDISFPIILFFNASILLLLF